MWARTVEQKGREISESEIRLAVMGCGGFGLTEQVCADPSWSLENAPVGPLHGSQRGLIAIEDWENVKKSRTILPRGTPLVKIGDIPSLERFQAQSKWEISAKAMHQLSV